jgi:hypothetical protein
MELVVPTNGRQRVLIDAAVTHVRQQHAGLVVGLGIWVNRTLNVAQAYAGDCGGWAYWNAEMHGVTDVLPAGNHTISVWYYTSYWTVFFQDDGYGPHQRRLTAFVLDNQETNKCAVSPCLNGGSCTLTNAALSPGYTCSCQSGFAGQFCQISTCCVLLLCSFVFRFYPHWYSLFLSSSSASSVCCFVFEFGVFFSYVAPRCCRLRIVLYASFQMSMTVIPILVVLEKNALMESTQCNAGARLDSPAHCAVKVGFLFRRC